MGFRRLDCFLAAARLKSFSSAAKYMFLSQSAISQQIAALEADMGVKLFNRTGGGAELTAAGAYLYPRIAMLKGSYEGHVAHARELAKDVEEAFRIGFDGPIAGEWIGEVLRRLAGEPFFAARPKLYRESLAALTERLVDGTVDVAITTDIEVAKLDGVNFVPLTEASPCVYYPEGHRFERMNYVTPEDLLLENVLGAYGSQHGSGLSASGSSLQGLGLSAEGLAQYPDGDTVFLAVSVGLGVFVASHLCDGFAKHYGVRSVDLHAPLPKVMLGIAYGADTDNAETFVRVAKRVIES